MRHNVKVIKQKIDLIILAATNAAAWLVEIEQALKVILLIVSLLYALDRWAHHRRTRGDKPEKD